MTSAAWLWCDVRHLCSICVHAYADLPVAFADLPVAVKGCTDAINLPAYSPSLSMQIVKNVKKLTLDAEGQPIEATLTKHLKHMGITRTLAHAWWLASDRGGPQGEKQCWMIMEYCDRGNIVVCTVLLPDHDMQLSHEMLRAAAGCRGSAQRCYCLRVIS